LTFNNIVQQTSRNRKLRNTKEDVNNKDISLNNGKVKIIAPQILDGIEEILLPITKKNINLLFYFIFNLNFECLNYIIHKYKR